MANVRPFYQYFVRSSRWLRRWCRLCSTSSMKCARKRSAAARSSWFDSRSSCSSSLLAFLLSWRYGYIINKVLHVDVIDTDLLNTVFYSKSVWNLHLKSREECMCSKFSTTSTLASQCSRWLYSSASLSPGSMVINTFNRSPRLVLSLKIRITSFTIKVF